MFKNYLQSFFPGVLVVIVSLIGASDARAGLILSFGLNGISSSGPLEAVAGSNSFIDLYVRRDASPTFALDNFSVVIQISALNDSPTNGLRFLENQSNANLQDNSYVLWNNSTAQEINLVPFSTVINNRYTASDSVNDWDNPVTVSTNNQLLTRIDLSAFAAGQYVLSVAANGTSFAGPIDDNFPTISYTASGATFNVTAVPEPSSMILLGASSTVLLALRRRKGATVQCK